MSDWFSDRAQNLKARLARAGALKAWQKESQDFIGIPRFVDRALDPSLSLTLPSAFNGGKSEKFGIQDLTVQWDDQLASGAVFRRNRIVASLVMGKFIMVREDERRQGIATRLAALWAERYPHKNFGMLRTREGHRIIMRAHRLVLERAIGRGEEIRPVALDEYPDLYAQVSLSGHLQTTASQSRAIRTVLR